MSDRAGMFISLVGLFLGLAICLYSAVFPSVKDFLLGFALVYGALVSYVVSYLPKEEIYP